MISTSLGIRLLAFAAFCCLHQGASACIFAEQQWGAVVPTPTESASQEEIDFINTVSAEIGRNFEPSVRRNANSRFRQYGEPVGRLELVLEDRESGQKCVSFCTAFLVAPDLALTNRHCLVGERTRAIRAALRLGFLSPDQPGRLFAAEIESAELGGELDYAIMRIDGRPGDSFGVASLTPVELSPGQDLLVIGHPLGQPQQFSTQQCQVAPQPATSALEFRHTCQTGSGNSGSPIFDERTGAVIAVHRRGPGQIVLRADPGEEATYRVALPINAIAAISPLLQSRMPGQARATLSGLAGFTVNVDILRNGSLFCRVSRRPAEESETVCPQAIPADSARSEYLVRGFAISGTNERIAIDGRASVDETDTGPGCELLLLRRPAEGSAAAAIEVGTVCG